MSFFNLSTGEQAQSTGSFETVTDIEPIPARTQVKAALEEIKWSEYDGERYINGTWSILQGDYKGRKIFQKIKVQEKDAKKRDKALMMLMAIDANAGGKLAAAGREPTDMDLMSALQSKPMALLLQVWSIKDEETGEVKKGNWVSAVSPLNKKPDEPVKSGLPEVSTKVGDDVGF